MKKALAVIIAVVVAFCAGFVVGSLDLVHFGKDKVTVKVLKEEVEQLSEIASLKCTTVESGEIKNSRKFMNKYKIPLTEKNLTAECSVVTKLGSDLTKADIEISDDQTQVTVKVPHSEILSIEIDEESWTIVTNKSGIFNGTKVEDDDQIRKDVKKAAKQRLKDNNSYAEADEATTAAITDFLTAAHPDMTVNVEFK